MRCPRPPSKFIAAHHFAGFDRYYPDRSLLPRQGAGHDRRRRGSIDSDIEMSFVNAKMTVFAAVRSRMRGVFEEFSAAIR